MVGQLFSYKLGKRGQKQMTKETKKKLIKLLIFGSFALLCIYPVFVLSIYALIAFWEVIKILNNLIDYEF